MSTDRSVLEKGRLYQLPEVAAILGVDVGTVRHWVRSGVLPAKRIGRLFFVYGGDLVPEQTFDSAPKFVGR
jgi:excisionase family DNA binding protein